jgi:hypothetical protein
LASCFPPSLSDDWLNLDWNHPTEHGVCRLGHRLHDDSPDLVDLGLGNLEDQFVVDGQQALHSLGSQDHQDRVHQSSLAYTGTARDEGGATGQDSLQCFPLARGERISGPLLAPRDGLFEVDRWVDPCRCGQPPDLRRNASLRLPQVRQEEQAPRQFPPAQESHW